MTNLDVNAVGSQFFIVYGDASALPAEYTQLATITTGLEIVEQVAAAGAVDDAGSPTSSGKPAQALTITGLSVTDPADPGASPSAADPSASPTEAAPSTSATS